MSQHTPDDLGHRRERKLLTRHRGLATWGERLVPLADFRAAAARSGVVGTAAERAAAVAGYLASAPDATPVEGPFRRILVFGGVYNNWLALEATLALAGRRAAEAIYCLGDLGGFGPHPDRVWPLLEAGAVRTVMGNYEESLSSGREDCNCGYTDPRDNHFARLSYDYTARHTSTAFKAWMGTLPRRRRVRLGDRTLLLVHGSPRRINEFLFRSTSPVAFLERLLDAERADGVLCTHTGLPWHRRLPSGRDVVNVGVIGRPPNDGDRRVAVALLGTGEGGDLEVQIERLAYDHLTLAAAMRDEELPAPFVETIESGWWTTCLEILPATERRRSRY